MQADAKKLAVTQGHSPAQKVTRTRVTSDSHIAQSSYSEKVAESYPCLEKEPFQGIAREPLEQDVPEFTEARRKPVSPSPPTKEDKVHVLVDLRRSLHVPCTKFCTIGSNLFISYGNPLYEVFVA